MVKYLMILGSVILISIPIINLSPFKFKAKEVVEMVFLSWCAAAALLNISEFLGIIPILVISGFFIYKNSKSIVSSISIPISAVLIVVLFDYVINNVLILIFSINTIIMREDIRLFCLLFGVAASVIFLVTKLLRNLIYKKVRIISIQYKGKFGLLIVVSLILTLIIFYTNIIFGESKGFTKEIIKINGILFFAYFILLMIIIGILINSLTKELEFKNKQSQLESLKEYNNSLEKMHWDMRAFRHDYINILSSMIGYIDSRDMDGLEKYFNGKILPLSRGVDTYNFKIDRLKNIKIPEIKGIFASKLIRAQELGIDVFIDIMEPIQRIDIDIVDLCRCTGILLDNAIEAAEKADNPLVKVAFINKEKSVMIVIINSYKDEVPIYKIYQKDFSTKGENRGLGLNNLRKVIGNYTNVSLETLVENGEFKQILQVSNQQ